MKNWNGTTVDQCRLTSVIRSLEVEIDQCTKKVHDSLQENNQGVADFEYNWQSCDQSPKNTIEFNWMEKETNVNEVDDISFWEIETNDDHEIDGVSNYCYGDCLEENNCNSCLWEEKYAPTLSSIHK